MWQRGASEAVTVAALLIAIGDFNESSLAMAKTTAKALVIAMAFGRHLIYAHAIPLQFWCCHCRVAIVEDSFWPLVSPLAIGCQLLVRASLIVTVRELASLI